MEKSWLELEGKVAIVTGGACGIGKVAVQELLDNGVNVVVSDINPEVPKFEVSEKGGKMLYVVTDVSNSKSVQDMIDSTINEFGKIDILVNNAGINIPRLLIDTKNPKGEYELDEAVWDKVVDINFKGVFFCTQSAVREMVKAGSGVVINMSSESGLEGSEGQSIYAATKNAVNSLTRSWSKELGKHNIRVVGIAPGILEATGLRTISYETALAYTRGITVEALREGYNKTSTIPLGRSGKLKEVADLVCYMASDRASYIHGVTFNVAGGKTRG